MEIPLEPDSHSTKEMISTPCQAVSSSLIEDSGYLSQEQSSCQFNVSQSCDVGVSSERLMEPLNTPYSIKQDEPFISPVISMAIDDLSLGKSVCNNQSIAYSKPADLLQDVWQSTPAMKRLCKNVHKEFEFATPLPGPLRCSYSNTISLDGQQYVDILFQLAVRRIQPPLQKILNYLEPEDLCHLRLVSSHWRKLLNSVPQVKVWQHFVKVRQQNKENSMLICTKLEESQDLLVTPVSTRGQLRDIHNLVLVPTKQSNHSPPVSPSKLHSSRYIKEGRKLKCGEKLRKCPKCAWPSRTDNNKTGVRCTGRICGFHFCIDCSGPFHENTPCPSATPVTPTKARNRANKTGKQNRLRRLLL